MVSRKILSHITSYSVAENASHWLKASIQSHVVVTIFFSISFTFSGFVKWVRLAYVQGMASEVACVLTCGSPQLPPPTCVRVAACALEAACVPACGSPQLPPLTSVHVAACALEVASYDMEMEKESSSEVACGDLHEEAYAPGTMAASCVRGEPCVLALVSQMVACALKVMVLLLGEEKLVASV
ncbi:hypothetical protein EZV62_007891 [Acer yangbiense]|uniref:Uncharacterized protein n=1 Tax=Acer yangbiense TaxID=1000413 RepID=A0A5C7IDZ5_9ROSI|nr:hypothetical protein EZV62_007891 [Acer yangbiense]